MSTYSESVEIEEIIGRFADNMALTVSSQTGAKGSALRRAIGQLEATLTESIVDKTLPDKIMACFTAAQDADVSLLSLSSVRARLIAEVPVGDLAKAITQSMIVMCLATESRLITEIEFTSRTDVDLMMAKMKIAFDEAKELAADQMDSNSYQKLTYLSGALTNHLATAGRPLPRMVQFILPRSLPALAASMLMYRDATRWEEIVEENKTVHPAFLQRELVGLAE